MSGSRVMWKVFQEQTALHLSSPVFRGQTKEATAALSATVLVVRPQNVQGSLWVS